MISVSGNHWEETKINRRIIEKLNNDLNYSETISKLIVSRKFSQIEIESINEYIKITNPFMHKYDFIEGYKILKKSLENNEKILVIGDYDVDGCVSTSLLINFLKQLSKKVEFYIPNRFKDGYGASLILIKKLILKEPKLIIMVDCGSNSFASVNFLKSKNIKTIIIDHHEIYKPYPKSDCLINPKKECDYNKFDYLCSSTLVYFFIDFFIKKKNLDINFDKNLIYVLLATVCDVMPLRNFNRILAINILKDFDINKNDLFKKIFLQKKINKPFEIDDLGFVIGPILNSAGRLGDANLIVNLLTSKNKKKKEQIIDKLIQLNEKRKKIENDVLGEMDFNKISKNKQKIIIENNKIIHEGIIGIIASRLKEYFNKPTIVLTKYNDIYKASARSTANFNIGIYIKQGIDKDIILDGGGHNLAAGFSIKRSKFNEFNKFINKVFIDNAIDKPKKYLSKISLNTINNEFLNDIKKIGPFGNNNPNPFFLLESIKILKPQLIKDKYVKFFAQSKSGKLFPGISFNHFDSQVNKNLLFNKKEMNLIVQINENLWNNKYNLQLNIIDLII